MLLIEECPGKPGCHVTPDGRRVAPVGTLLQQYERAMAPRYRRGALAVADQLDELLELLENDPRRRQLIADRLGVRR